MIQSLPSAVGNIIENSSFNLRAFESENSVKIIVNSGKVAFYSKSEQSNKIILTKGLTGSYHKENNQLIKSDVFNVNYQSWKTGKLLFFKSNLSDVCKALEYHYNKKIQIANSELEQLIISASYENQTFEEIIEIISETLDIDYSVQNDSVIFSLN